MESTYHLSLNSFSKIQRVDVETYYIIAFKQT